MSKLKDVDLDQIPRTELLQQTPAMRVEFLLREMCNRKRGKLGFCKTKSHSEEAKQMFSAMKEWGLQ